MRWSLEDDSWAERELPPGVRVFDVDRGHLVAMRLGEFDEQYLQLHRVVRGR